MPEQKTFTTAQLLRAASFRCLDCGEYDPEYMVRDEVWAQAFPTPRAVIERELQDALELRPGARRAKPRLCVRLCLACLSARLGRPLVLEDFKEFRDSDGLPLPVNTLIFEGYRMAARAIVSGIIAAQREARTGEIPDKTGDKNDVGG